jgi:predicted PurR-regulated permease PerM
MAHKYTKTEFTFLLICLVISLIFVFAVFRSFIGSFIFASIFSASLLPAHKKLIAFNKIFSKQSSAFILIVVLSITLIAPFTFIIMNSVDELWALINNFQVGTSGNMETDSKNQYLINKMMNMIHQLSGQSIALTTLEQQWIKLTQYITNQAMTWTNSLANNFATFIFNYLIFILTIFIILTKGDGLKKNFYKLSLLPEKDEEALLKKIENLSRVLLLGNSLGGIIQSLVAFIAMSFIGIEKIFFWSLLILVCSFVPVLGSSLVFLPMSIYLWMSGEKMYALILFAVMSTVFVIVENWFKPKFIGGRIQMHPLIILFSMLGGVSFFGIAGLFYGPLITTIFLYLFDLYFQQTNLS